MSEDIAELTTIYHLTSKLNQPFHIILTRKNVEITLLEPMKNVLVRQQLDQLAPFL